MARKKDKKVDGKKKPTTNKKAKKSSEVLKQSQKQSVHIHLGKSTTKRKPKISTTTKSSQQPIVNVNPVVYTMPSYSNDLTRLENKISELSGIVKPVKQVSIEKPVKGENKPLAEILDESIINYYQNPHRFTSPKPVPPKPPMSNPPLPTTGEESEAISINEAVPIIRRRGRTPKIKTSEELEQERVHRNIMARLRRVKKREQERQMKLLEEKHNREDEESDI